MTRCWPLLAILAGSIGAGAMLPHALAVAGPFFPSAGTIEVEFLPQPSEAERRIRRALQKRVSLRFQYASLGDLADYLRGVTGENLYLDTDELSDLGIDPAERMITVNLRSVPLKTALELILDELEVTAIVHDGLLRITARGTASELFVTRVYPVSDLVSFGGGQDFDPLIELIENTIDVDSWDPVGLGTMQEFEATGVLVINQTHAVHDQVLELLRGLRASRYVSYDGNSPGGGASGSFFPAADRRATLPMLAR